MTSLRITRSKVRLAVALALVPAALLVNKATAAQPQGEPPAEPTVVRTDAGQVRGQSSGGVRVFNAIPYAAPPVQGLRWKSPQPVTHWDGVRDALELSSACVPSRTTPRPPSQPGQGAAHATELPYLFSLGGQDWPISETQQRLSEQMIDYWTAFARTGNPNGPDRPYWAPASNGDIHGLSLAPADQGGIKLVNLSTDHHCHFWAGLS